MQASLLEILREIPDHRRAEGKRFDLATVLLYSILAMVVGANSYRQMHEFIRIHRQLLNVAFSLEMRYSPSYTGLRLILRGVDLAALETAFRRHASAIAAPPATEGLTAIAVDGKTLRGSFDAFCDRKAAHGPARPPPAAPRWRFALASCLEPRNRPSRHVIASANLRKRLRAMIAALDRLAPLMSLARVDVAILGSMLPGLVFTTVSSCCRHGGA